MVEEIKHLKIVVEFHYLLRGVLVLVNQDVKK